MPNRRIDQLNPNLDPLTGNELIPIFDVVNNTTERISINTLASYLDETGDTFVTGGTYNPNTGVIELTRNDGDTISITGVTETPYINVDGGTSVDFLNIKPKVGNNNITSTNYSNIGGGYDNNITSSTYSTVDGGYSNRINLSSYSNLGGGYSNEIHNSAYGSILGGSNNNLINSNFVSSVLGGYANTISGGTANTIVGGYFNTMGNYDLYSPYFRHIGDNRRSTIASGQYNKLIRTRDSFIGGGYNNLITTQQISFNYVEYSAIINGFNNVINSTDTSAIVTGRDNKIIGQDDGSPNKPLFGIIGGGRFNVISADTGNKWSSSIVGGEFNEISNSNTSFIGGGQNNLIKDSDRTFIIGGYGNQITGGTRFGGEYKSIGGGTGNKIFNSSYSNIVDGFGNEMLFNGFINTIITGIYNRIEGDDDDSTSAGNIIGGGSSNLIHQCGESGLFPDLAGVNTILNGNSNTITGDCRNSVAFRNTIVGGEKHKIFNSKNSTIGGGYQNTILLYNQSSTIGGGIENKITEGYQIPQLPLPQFPNFRPLGALGNVIGGGGLNTIEGTVRSFPNGNNYSSGFEDGKFNTIGGGYRNYVNGQYNTIAGGGRRQSEFATTYEGGNTITGNSSTISGGLGHVIKGRYSTIGGGGFYDFKRATLGNTIIGNMSTIAGGFYNTIDTSPWYTTGFNPGNSISAILGGSGHKINNGLFSWSTIGGGAYNYIHNGGSFIGGGGSNQIGYGLTPTSFPNDGYRSAIVGGYSNKIYSEYSFIGGGDDNRIFIDSGFSIIGNGQNNRISGSYSSILGGEGNEIRNYSQGSTIVGGFSNEISLYAGSSFIGGGQLNEITNYNYGSVVGGGRSNTINNSYYSSIVGGKNNNIIGSSNNSQYNAILGGRNNTIPTGSTDTFIIGSNITSISANTTHVERFNIKTVNTGSTSNDVLVLESNGMVNTKTIDGKGYKSYEALLIQTGTTAPIATILNNELSGTPVWSRSGAGDYRLTLAGEFTLNKTVIITGNKEYTLSSSTIDPYDVTVGQVSVNEIYVDTVDNATLVDGKLGNNTIPFFIEVRVYS